MNQSYSVAGVPLIPQDQGMACWYASAQMLIQWRRNRRQMTESAFRDPSEVSQTVALYRANNGLPFDQNVRFAQLIGLRPVPPQTPTPDAIYGWLQRYGPIWAAGQKVTATNRYGHVFVIVGISENLLYLHDPEPVNIGSRITRNFSWLVDLLEWGNNSWVVSNFLHFPG